MPCAVNEKLAIERFAAGLRDCRLSVIIDLRNFSSLIEAIESAQDEEIPGPRNLLEFMGTFRQWHNPGHRTQRGY